MKKSILLSTIFLSGICFSMNSLAQDPPSPKKNTEEIIIKKDGDKPTKMTIEIDSDNVTINGKPSAEYHDGNITINQHDFIDKDLHNFLYSPGNDNAAFQHFFDDIKNPAPTTFLGIMMNKADEGAKITSVIKASAADKSGLLKGDVIIKIDNKNIMSPNDVTDAVNSHKTGDEIKVYYLRGDNKKNMTIKLGENRQEKKEFNFNYKMPPTNDNSFDFNMAPINKLRGLKQLYNFNYDNDDKPKLGAKVEDTEDKSGVKIISVEDGSAADKAGLKKDDIITTINNEKVGSVNEIKDQLDEAGDKGIIQVKAMRNNSEMNFDIKIPKKLNSADL